MVEASAAQVASYYEHKIRHTGLPNPHPMRLIDRFARDRCRRVRPVLLGVAGVALGASSLAGAIPALEESAVALTPGAAAAAFSDAGGTPGNALAEVTVSAGRLQLLGNASSASEGVVEDTELQLLPQYRPGQTLETVPGLIVTLHSGEGKANQYLLRGYNLDHGTDLATFVDGMPVNQPTHAHGQGYTDLNFMIPELQNGLTYTKGPYYADIGDFGGVGSVHVTYRDTIPDQFAVISGSFDFQRYFAAGSRSLGSGNLLAAVEIQHVDGPFANPDDARKQNAVLRYSQTSGQGGFSLTGMFYHQLWNNTTDIPLRAITEGLVGDRFGTLDPTDGGRSQRASFSFNGHAPLGEGLLTASAFFEYNQLHIYNDFTHFLFDPVHGDQEDQFENRRAHGAAVTYAVPVTTGPFEHQVEAGLVTRYDLLESAACPPRRAYRWRPPVIRALSPMMTTSSCSQAPPTRRSPRTGCRNCARYWVCATTISTAPTSTISQPCTRRRATPTPARRISRCCSPRVASSTCPVPNWSSICQPARAFTARISAA
jgi:hypothetical protein